MPSNSSPSWRNLQFVHGQEAQFQQYYAHELNTRMRWAAVAALPVMLVYAVLDAFMVPQALVAPFLWIRGLFVIVPLLLVVAATYRRAWLAYMQWIAGAAALSVGLSIVTFVCMARRHGTPIEYEGIILTLFYFYCCGGLRLKTACLAGFVIALVYPLAERWAGLGTHEVIVRALFLMTANVVGMISSAIMEFGARRSFWMQQQLKEAARHDFLTGLLNRRALSERLQWLWRHAMREARSMHIAMVDVDYFKQYNDFYGHTEGDVVLQQVAQVLQRHTQRALDVAARYGGEEFVCVWTGNSEADMQALLAHLQADIQALQIPHARSKVAATLTLSIGWVHVQPAAGGAVETALQAADAALYAAKAQGRNRSVQAP